MGYLTAAGARLEARVLAGAADGAATLVFLHEGLGSVSAWRDFPDRVASATGLAALVYSRRGYGASDPAPRPWPAAFMHDEAFDVLPAVLDAAGIQRALLVGHSDGASIALLCAARLGAARVPAVVALAPHLFVEDVTVASIARAVAGPDLRARLRRHHSDPDATLRGWSEVWLSPGFRAWNIEAEITGIAQPVLVIQGRDDEYGTLAQVDALRRAVRGPLDALILDRCGHAPHRDHPGEVVDAIAAFVRGVGARETR